MIGLLTIIDFFHRESAAFYSSRKREVFGPDFVSGGLLMFRFILWLPLFCDFTPTSVSKPSIVFFSSSAWALISSAADADSSALDAFSWATASILLTA